MENETNALDRYEPIAYLSEADAKRFTEFLAYSGINEFTNEKDSVNSSYVVSVRLTDFEKAQNLFAVFSENELYECDNAKQDTDLTKNNGSIYSNSTEKYNDNLSSAITFLVCGAAGILVLILNALNILKLFRTTGAYAVLTYTVLGILFGIFIFIGVKSLFYSKQIKSELDTEKQEKSKIYAWLNKAITLEDIETSYDSDIPEEMKYFNRSEFLKNKILSEYPNTPDFVVEAICDEYIEKNF